MTWQAEVAQIFAEHGIPAEVWATIMMRESGGNPAAVGDQGYALGLFQMHTGVGLGRGHSREQLFDPVFNARLAARSLAGPVRQGKAKGLQGLDLVRFAAPRAGFPWFRGTLPDYYERGLPGAFDRARAWLANGPTSPALPGVRPKTRPTKPIHREENGEWVLGEWVPAVLPGPKPPEKSFVERHLGFRWAQLLYILIGLLMLGAGLFLLTKTVKERFIP